MQGPDSPCDSSCSVAIQLCCAVLWARGCAVGEALCAAALSLLLLCCVVVEARWGARPGSRCAVWLSCGLCGSGLALLLDCQLPALSLSSWLCGQAGSPSLSLGLVSCIGTHGGAATAWSEQHSPKALAQTAQDVRADCEWRCAHGSARQAARAAASVQEAQSH